MCILLFLFAHKIKVPREDLGNTMNPALSQEFHLFCEQEHPQRHANTDKNPYCAYGTLNVKKTTTPELIGSRNYVPMTMVFTADHERNWPPCKVVFFGWATKTLNVRNNNSNNNYRESAGTGPVNPKVVPNECCLGR